MSKDTIIEFKTPEAERTDPLTDLLRTGAQQLIASAVEAELLESRDEGSRLGCRCTVNGREVASATIMFANLDRNKAGAVPEGNFVFTEELRQLLHLSEVAEEGAPPGESGPSPT